MRRGREEVEHPAVGGQRRREALEQTDLEPVIQLLEPMVTDQRRQRICDVLAGRLDSVTVVLDSLHDPHNGAAIIRSCDAFGVARAHALERLESFVAAGTVAKGSQHWVEVVGHRNAGDLIEELEASGHQLVAAHPEGELEPTDLASLDRVALLLGNEHAGICAELLAACRNGVRVPMRGFVESLNVSVTAAVLLHAATAGRPGDLSPARARRLYATALIHTVPRSSEILAARGIELGSQPSTTHEESEKMGGG